MPSSSPSYRPTTAVSEPPPAPGWQGWRGPVLVGLIVFSFALVGILSRPLNFSSALWAANPVLAGILVRHPHLLRVPWAWLSAFIGFIAADLLTGSSLLTTLLFTLANFVGVAACCAVLMRANHAHRFMQGQHSALLLFTAALTSAAASCLLGGPISMFLFDSPMWPSFAMWLSGELMSFTLILPVILSFPRQHMGDWHAWMPADPEHPVWQRVLPLMAVVASVWIASVIGGPGTLSFVVPALLWCALSYGFLLTAVLCLVVCLWLSTLVAGGQFEFTPEYWPSALSLRVGITLLALGPFAVASNRAARKHAIDRLHHVVNHDFLTGLLSRKAFFHKANGYLRQSHPAPRPVAVLAMDLDHFKRINDTYGHTAGDEVLRQFALVAASHLRQDDLLGRIGGEEFVAMLPNTPQLQAQALAEKMVHAVCGHPFHIPGQEAPLNVTVSLGMVHCAHPAHDMPLDALMHEADVRLYEAKQTGRNRVVSGTLEASADTSPPHSPSLRHHATGPH